MEQLSLKEKVRRLTNAIQSETDNYIEAVGEGNTDTMKELRNNLTFLQKELQKTLLQITNDDRKNAIN